jgi:3-hydroxyisobutyrate dehydrogenase-like beta-hydroxyacid dehydrogenase
MVSLPKSFGFVGLGAMGYPMATQLRRKLPSSTPLSIFDLDKAVLQRFVQEYERFGEVHIAASSREVAERAVSLYTVFCRCLCSDWTQECIITIVPEGSHVRAVYLTPGTGLLATDTAGKLFIDR